MWLGGTTLDSAGLAQSFQRVVFIFVNHLFLSLLLMFSILFSYAFALLKIYFFMLTLFL
jgi:hypothetical protein